MARYLAPRHVCLVLGIPYRTLVDWHKRGIAVPDIESLGRGTPHLYSPCKIWAIGVGRILRQHGAPFELAASVTVTLADFRADYVIDCFSKKPPQDCLLVVNGLVLPKLMPRDAIDSPELSRLVKTAQAHDQSADVRAIEVKTIWDQIQAAIENIEAERERKARRNRERAGHE